MQRTIRRVMLISAIFTSAALMMLALIGQLNVKTAGGVFTGALAGMGNFGLLAATVSKIGCGMEMSEAKRRMRAGYALRMLLMALFSIAAIAFIGVDPLCHALLMPSASLAARLGKR